MAKVKDLGDGSGGPGSRDNRDKGDVEHTIWRNGCRRKVAKMSNDMYP